MKLLRELISAARVGGHAGKGNKYSRQGNYEKALYHYRLAIKQQEESITGPNPALLEYFAITHAHLGDLTEAYRIAEQALNLCRELDTKDQFVAESIVRLEYFIELLRNNDTENLKKYLSSD